MRKWLLIRLKKSLRHVWEVKMKTEKAKTPKLEAPLSVLTKDSDVPLKDMHAWVHRSAELDLGRQTIMRAMVVE